MNRNNSTSEEGNHSTKSEEQKKKELLERSTKTSRVASSSSLRQWSNFRDPRIVRASRAFGGKDRHSKVCTVRGLRDRRIRLSVPTAVELYDLQEKLGVSQPSKVVDWLLDATKQDIDKLPPLQMPLGFHQQMFGNNLPTSHSFFPIRVNGNFGGDDETLKGKEVVPKENIVDEKGKSIIEVNDLQKNQLYAQSFFPMPYAFNQWDPSSNFSMPQLGSHHGFQLQTENLFNPNSTQMPSSSIFPPCPSNYLTPDSSRQMNHFQFMNAGSSISLPTSFMPSLHPPMRSFHKNANPKFLHHQGNDRSDELDDSEDDC